MKASFHPSRQLGLTEIERQRLAQIESKRTPLSSPCFIDSTEHIYRYFKDGAITDESLISSLVSDDAVVEAAGLERDSESQPGIVVLHGRSVSEPDITTLSAESATEPSRRHPTPASSDLPIPEVSREQEHVAHEDFGGDILYTQSHHGSPTAATLRVGNSPDDVPSLTHMEDAMHVQPQEEVYAGPTPSVSFGTADDYFYDLPFSLGLALSYGPDDIAGLTPRAEPECLLQEAETLEVLHSFITSTATWCETTDTARNLSVVFAHDIIAHPICKAAALALACRHRSIFDNGYAETALQLYQYTIQLLIRQDPDRADHLVLTACILLCVYEMISSDVADWRRHLKVLRHVN